MRSEKKNVILPSLKRDSQWFFCFSWMVGMATKTTVRRERMHACGSTPPRKADRTSGKKIFFFWSWLVFFEFFAFKYTKSKKIGERQECNLDLWKFMSGNFISMATRPESSEGSVCLKFRKIISTPWWHVFLGEKLQLFVFSDRSTCHNAFQMSLDVYFSNHTHSAHPPTHSQDCMRCLVVFRCGMYFFEFFLILFTKNALLPPN